MTSDTLIVSETTTIAETAATPSNAFDSLELAPFLKKTIASIGYTQPTPIQAKAIPLVLQGKDLIGLAQTGTGKTAAFVLPLLHNLSITTSQKATKALILAPTRELAEQINEVIGTFAPRTGVKSVTVYGGVSHQNQIRSLRGKPEIVVACPGRLLDHVRGRTIDLSTIEYLILDEADRMLDMGFLPDIKKIIQQMPKERQTLLFSATMPDEIQSLSSQVLNNPEVVRVKSEAPVALVTHSMYQVKDTEKQNMLTSWLSANPEALVVVFTKMKHTAKRLSERLEKVGYDATSLHGNLSQGKRQHALNGFRDGRYRIMIATDIAARGIDVDGITHVINYDMPETLDAYIHRSGRAGRAMRTGDAVSFVTRSDGYIIRHVEKWLGTPLKKLEALSAANNSDAEMGTDRDSYDEAPPQRFSNGRSDRRTGGRADAAGRRREKRDSKRSGFVSTRETRTQGAQGDFNETPSQASGRASDSEQVNAEPMEAFTEERSRSRAPRGRGLRDNGGSRSRAGSRGGSQRDGGARRFDRRSGGERRARGGSDDAPPIFNKEKGSRFDRAFGESEVEGRDNQRSSYADRSSGGERRGGGRPERRGGDRARGGRTGFSDRREDRSGQRGERRFDRSGSGAGEGHGLRFDGERTRGPRRDQRGASDGGFPRSRGDRRDRPGSSDSQRSSERAPRRTFRGQQDVADTSGKLVGDRAPRGDRGERRSSFGGGNRPRGGRAQRSGGSRGGFGGRSRQPRVAAYD